MRKPAAGAARVKGGTSAPVWSGLLLGMSFGGFFDGILLHQILQWHHLLSSLADRGAPFSDLRFQILADGYFHLLMYALAVVGLGLLWRSRDQVYLAGGARRLLGYVLIGFGGWHVLDAVASHWVLGIHRIRMDAANPLLWDIGWFVLFGAAPLVAGLALRRQRSVEQDGSGGHRTVSLLFAGCLAGGAWSAMPSSQQDYAAIVFAPAVSFEDGFRAASAYSEGVWRFDGDGVFLVRGLSLKNALNLYANGALLVGGAGAPFSCGSWLSG